MDMECIIPNSIGQGEITSKGWCMDEIYDKTQLLYIDTDASGIWLGAALLQTWDGTKCPRGIAPDNSILRLIAFASKSLTSTESWCSNSEREALGILHGVEKFCHYCFAREVSIITDHKPLVAIFKNMLQHCCKEYNEFSSGYINSESKYYTNLDQIWSKQTCFPDTTISKTKVQKYLAWKWGLMPYRQWQPSPRVHVNTTSTTSNITGWSLTMTKRVHHHRLARE